MRGLLAISKNDAMDAVWFLNIMRMFISSLTSPNIFFGIRLQYLKKDGLLATFFCDNNSKIEFAKKCGYTTKTFHGFTGEMIQQMWKIREFHWEVEVYAYSDIMDDPLSTLAFRSYGPALEMYHEPNNLIPESAILLFMSNLDDFTILNSADCSLAEYLDWTVEGFDLPLSDPRFDSIKI
jgi:hypothetical protein